MHRNQRIGRVALLRGVAGHNVALVLGSLSVAAGRVPPRSEAALSQGNGLRILVAIVLAVLTGDVWQITGSSHILEGGVQKGVFRLTVLGVAIDNTHRLVTLERPRLYVLNFKPSSPGETLRQSTKGRHCPPQSQQQHEEKASQKPWAHLFCVRREKMMVTEKKRRSCYRNDRPAKKQAPLGRLEYSDLLHQRAQRGFCSKALSISKTCA